MKTYTVNVCTVHKSHKVIKKSTNNNGIFSNKEKKYIRYEENAHLNRKAEKKKKLQRWQIEKMR